MSFSQNKKSNVKNHPGFGWGGLGEGGLGYIWGDWGIGGGEELINYLLNGLLNG